MRFDYREYIRDGEMRCDITKLLASPSVMSALVSDMAEPFLNDKIDKVVAIDSLGFVFGSRIAEKLNAGLVLLRKAGKLSIATKTTSPFFDYTKTEKAFEIAYDAISEGERLLVVDDWSETGSQLKAAIPLLESVGGKIIGVTCINIDKPVLEDPILSKYKLRSVLKND